MRSFYTTFGLLLIIATTFGQGQPVVGISKNVDPFAQLLPVIKEDRLPYVDTSKKIKSIIQRSYRPTVLNGQLQKGNAIEEIAYNYDEHGGLIKREIKNPVDMNNEEEISILPHSFNSEPVVNNSYTYDARGNLLAIPHLPGVYGASQKFKYNNQDEVIELRQYFPGDTLQWVQVSKYNEQHQLIEQDDQNSRGQVVAKKHYRYDAKGNKTEMFTVDEDNRIPTHWKLTFDTSNRITEMLVTGYEARPKKQLYKYLYDAQGRKDKIYITAGDSTRLYSFYKYDVNGAGYQYSEYNSNGTVVNTIGDHTKKQDRFDGRTKSLLVTREWRYDKRKNTIFFLEIRYPPAAQSQLPPQMVLETDEIKYR